MAPKWIWLADTNELIIISIKFAKYFIVICDLGSPYPPHNGPRKWTFSDFDFGF